MESVTKLISKSYTLALKNQPPYILSLFILSILALIAYFGQDVLLVESGLFITSTVSGTEHESESHEPRVPEVEKLPFALGQGNGSCDMFKGKWVWDNVSYPLYKEEECPYMDPQQSCLANGRPDRDYQFWRWQPHGCDIPRSSRVQYINKIFNSTLFMESIRDKRMLFVGDSLNRGQFYSTVCLIHSAVPDSEGSIKQHDSFITFFAKNYNATIEFYWAPYLLESNSDSFYAHKISDGVVRKNSIEKHGENWKGADVIIFDSYIWWLTGSDMKVLEGSFEDKPQHIVTVTTEEAYGMGMNVMIKWVNENMDRKKTRVFFATMSPFHHMSAEWGGRQWGNCANETTMIANETFWGAGCRKSMMQVIKDEVGKSSYPITLLNITQLSMYRKDAHIGIHKKRWSTWTPETTAIQLKYPDCMHYCLPGLQDTWNELLFAKLLYP